MYKVQGTMGYKGGENEEGKNKYSFKLQVSGFKKPLDLASSANHRTSRTSRSGRKKKQCTKYKVQWEMKRVQRIKDKVQSTKGYKRGENVQWKTKRKPCGFVRFPPEAEKKDKEDTVRTHALF